MEIADKPCELCQSPGGTLLWQSSLCRIVRVTDPDYPGFCRVIWTAHVREMTDLEPIQQHLLMNVVFTVEAVLRDLLSPDKINLASFGNMTPHLHWHIIPRWQGDRHFPEPIWGRVHNDRQRSMPAISDQILIQALRQKLPSGDSHA